MARPQQFERNDVLDKALSVFWKKGFESTSVQDLVDVTGLNRGSIYLAFGDKAELFAEVMEHYTINAPTKPLAEALSNPDSSANTHTVIVSFFNALVKRARADQDQKGCLLTNTSAGFYGCNDAMTEWVRDTLGRLEDMLCTLVKQGQDRGDITCTDKPRAIARSLVASAQGLNVMARTGAKSSVLKDIAAQAVRVLDK